MELGPPGLKQDHVGYGNSPPYVKWPGNARICVSFVINYEEGGESTVLNGDAGSEQYLNEIIGTTSLQGKRNFVSESCYEYGSRVGIYRLLTLFRKHGIRTTIFAVARALEKNPNICKILMADKHDIASHHYRWNIYSTTSRETERDHLCKVMKVHNELCNGNTPRGMYIGWVTQHTKQLLYQHNNQCDNEQNKILWQSDCYNDDIPHWDYDGFDAYANKNDKSAAPILNIPYCLSANDFRYLLPNGFNSSDEFFAYCKDTFDVLYQEGGKMMSIGLHARICGRPGRLAGLRKFVEYITQAKFAGNVWITTRTDIADFWNKNYPPRPSVARSKL